MINEDSWFPSTFPAQNRCMCTSAIGVKLKTEHTFVIIQLELFHSLLRAAGIRLNPVKHAPMFVRMSTLPNLVSIAELSMKGMLARELDCETTQY